MARRALRDARIRTSAFAYFLRDLRLHQPAGFRQRLPDPRRPARLRQSFGGNAAIRLFYGYPYRSRPSTATARGAWVGRSRWPRPCSACSRRCGRYAPKRSRPPRARSGRAADAARRAERRARPRSEPRSGCSGSPRRSASCRRPARRWLRLPRARDLTVAFAFAGIGALAAQLAPTRRGALQIGLAVAATMLLAAGRRRHRRGYGVAALAHPTGLGRGAAPTDGRAPARSARTRGADAARDARAAPG